jgi:endonuclease/exonuclease/phosphatase family metal-dependent hydrolase
MTNTSGAPSAAPKRARMNKGMRYAIAVGLALVTAAVGRATLTSGAPPPTCVARADTRVRWLRIAPQREWGSLDRWCAAVGPPVLVDGAPREEATFPFAIATWNDHVGAGDIDAFVSDLRAGRLTGGHPVSTFVILMQEAYRGGPEVPSRDEAALRWASAERPPGPHGRDDVIAAATRLHLNAIYIPSMRNGAPDATNEDRGNAILSTVPISDITAVELPLERQRRVAIEATVTMRDKDGAATPIRFVDTHFTNMVMHHLWLFSESGRARQAHALEAAIPRDGALILGGDFNAWFGFIDGAYRELARGLRHADSSDWRPTFGPLRLDHLLFRLPPGWHSSLRRAESRYGSDHYALVAAIDGASRRSE